MFMEDEEVRVPNLSQFPQRPFSLGKHRNGVNH